MDIIFDLCNYCTLLTACVLKWVLMLAAVHSGIVFFTNYTAFLISVWNSLHDSVWICSHVDIQHTQRCRNRAPETHDAGRLTRYSGLEFLFLSASLQMTANPNQTARILKLHVLKWRQRKCYKTNQVTICGYVSDN